MYENKIFITFPFQKNYPMKVFLSLAFISLASIAAHAADSQQPSKENYEMQLNADPGLNLTIFKFFTVQPKETAIKQPEIKLDEVIDKDWQKTLLNSKLQSERSPTKGK